MKIFYFGVKLRLTDARAEGRTTYRSACKPVQKAPVARGWRERRAKRESSPRMKVMKKMILIAPVCFSFAAHSDGSVDESSFATMIKAMQEQMAQLKDDMNKKDETIAALKAEIGDRDGG